MTRHCARGARSLSPSSAKPGSAGDWLARAQRNLIRARNLPPEPGFFLHDACFDAQQASEKAIKAVLTHLGIGFAYTHNWTELLSLILNRGYEVTEAARQAGRLTEYAVATRYPPSIEDISAEEYKVALTIASHVYAWAVGMIAGGGEPRDQSQRCMACA